MSSNDRLIETIEHYKRNIIRASPDNEQVTDPKKIVYCLDKLSKLPISVSLLSVTGIGRTVNELRKFEGPISEKAKLLVYSWKAAVKAEEDSKPVEEGEGSDGEEHEPGEINGYHHNAEDTGSESNNTSDGEENPLTQNEPTDEDDDPDKENEIDEDSESEDEREKRLKFEEEKRAYEEYLKAKKKKTINGELKNEKEEKRIERNSSEHRERRKSDERRKEKEHRSENGKKKLSSDKQDKDKRKSSRDKHSSRDKDNGKAKERSKSRDNHRDSKHSKSSSKDSKTNSIDQFSEDIRIKKEKIDDGYEKTLDKRNGNRTSDKKETEQRSENRNGKSRREDKSSSSSKQRDKDDSKRKHKSEKDSERSSQKRSKAAVMVKQETMSSGDESNREESTSRESSVSASSSSVKKEKTESSSQRNREKEKRNNSRDGQHASSEPKKMKLVEANDGGFADALMSIAPSKKSSKKKTPSSSSTSSSKKSDQTSNHSPAKSSGSRSTTRSPSVHSSGSISPLNLLSGNVKLEPLEKLDIASTLPEISPDNYFKPHLYQSVEKANSVASHDDLCNIMTSKNQRTKVFSGSRVTLLKVPSLYESCIRILQENIDSLEYTGGVPYDILKPVLERCTAEQLYQLEHYNPYLMEDTGPHWQFHCNRDFRGQKLLEYETWRELYLRCMLEREKKLREVRNTIAQSKKQSLPVRTTKLAYVDSSFVKPPRQVARQQARHGTGSSSSSSSSLVNKSEVIAKATMGGYSSSTVIGGPAVPVTSVKPGNTGISAGTNNPLMKKKKAPLMMKALQSFKGFRRK